MKVCRLCGETKEFAEYYVAKRNKDGYFHECRKCCKKVGFLRWKKNQDRYTETRLKRYYPQTYGITFDQYQNMLEQQNGGCFICESKTITRLHVDHDHKTGKIRGLLCYSCNMAIGKMKDSPTLLRKLATYVEMGGVSSSSF